jgi:hypothetical protein
VRSSVVITPSGAIILPRDDAHQDSASVLIDTQAHNFSAALADLVALWQITGTTFNSGNPLYVALQNGDYYGAVYYENLVGPQYRRLCDTTSSSVMKMHLMRVGSDGAASDVVVKQWSESNSHILTLTGSGLGYQETVTQNGREERRQAARERYAP